MPGLRSATGHLAEAAPGDPGIPASSRPGPFSSPLSFARRRGTLSLHPCRGVWRVRVHAHTCALCTQNMGCARAFIYPMLDV